MKKLLFPIKKTETIAFHSNFNPTDYLYQCYFAHQLLFLKSFVKKYGLHVLIYLQCFIPQPLVAKNSHSKCAIFSTNRPTCFNGLNKIDPQTIKKDTVIYLPFNIYPVSLNSKQHEVTDIDIIIDTNDIKKGYDGLYVDLVTDFYNFKDTSQFFLNCELQGDGNSYANITNPKLFYDGKVPLIIRISTPKYELKYKKSQFFSQYGYYCLIKIDLALSSLAYRKIKYGKFVRLKFECRDYWGIKK